MIEFWIIYNDLDYFSNKMQEQDPAIMNQYQRNFDSRLAG